MSSTRTVLISLALGDGVAAPERRTWSEADAWRGRLATWVEDLGYEPAVVEDAAEVLVQIHARPFAASLVDAGLVDRGGMEIWRAVRPILGRRLVLMAPKPGYDLYLEALRAGVGAVLPLPPRPSMVEAAIAAVTVGTGGARGGWRRAAPPGSASSGSEGPRGSRGEGWRDLRSRGAGEEAPTKDGADAEDQASA